MGLNGYCCWYSVKWCLDGNAVLDYAWAVLYSDFVSTQADWEPLGLNSKIVWVSPKSVLWFFLMEHPIFDTRFEN